MTRSLLPAGFVLGSAVLAFGQTADPLLYERFLRHVARSSVHTVGVVLLNGQPTGFRSQSLQEHLNLSVEEGRILGGIAAECAGAAASWDAAAKPLVLELRLARLDGRQPVESIARRLEAVQRERRAVVADLVKRLRYELGEVRFDALDAFVRSRRDGFSMAPPLVPQ